MSGEKLCAKFDNWNPMKSDYRNTEFNKYISGPGADLDEKLQPGWQARDVKLVPTLVFKFVPKGMTTMALEHICSKHGRVREVRDSKRNAFYFVDMATVADMEAVYRALENNNYGFKILVGKEKEKTPFDMERLKSEQNVPSIPSKNTGINFESRSYHTSTKNLPRPKILQENPFNASNLNNIGLPVNLLANDAFSLERQGLNKMADNKNFSYRNGRSYVNMPEDTKQFIDKKHKESSGGFIENDDKYFHISKGAEMPNNIKKCSQCYYACDTVCCRCSQYYCSIECQKSDWPEHRYICGKPKHLQKTPPLEKENRGDNNSSAIRQEKTIVKTKFPASKEIPVKIISPEQLTKSPKSLTGEIQSISKNTSQHETATSKIISPNELTKPSKSLPRQLQSISKKMPQHETTTSEISPQHPHSQNTNTPQSSISSKPKKLPAALRISSQQCADSSEKSTQCKTISVKSAVQNLPDSPPSTSKNISINSADKTIEDDKQNMPRSGNIVTITSISKPNLVFIRSITYEANLSYINTVDTLQMLGKNLPKLKTLPKSGEVVVSKLNEQFNRALVLSVSNPSNIIIHFMDYGNMEQTKLENLLEAPKEFIYKPRHAIPVMLKDVVDVYMTEEIRKFMHAYLNNINVEIRYKPQDLCEDNNVYAVELIDETTQQNLNKMIMKLSKPVEPRNIEEICVRDYLARKILPGGKNVEYIIMDNSLMCSGCISCTTKSYAIEIEKFKKDIQAYVKTIPEEAYTPRVNELCIAQYEEDGLWYRGMCLETVGDGYPSIHFIDYGNITILPIENIRRYPRQFTYPVYTVDCAIEGLPEMCDDKIVKTLEELIPNGELIKFENVTVDEESNFYIVSLPNVIRELTKRGLITM